MPFNPTRLTLARKRRGLTKTELAKRIGVDLRTITAYEAGEYPPHEDTLGGLSRQLQFPLGFFSGDDVEEPQPDAASFRALSRMTARQRDMALSQGALAVHLSRWLEERYELPPPALPDLSRESDAESAAAALRAAWGLGQLSIRNMIHLLEAKGVRVFSLSVEAREVDAFSMWRGDTPYVFLNTVKSAEHGRFDAAHELGHLVLHKHGSPQGRDAERQADAFASAFLMPRGSILANAPRFPTLQELIRLKKTWTTSVSAVNYRLHALGLLSDWHYRTLCIEMVKRKYHVSEPEGAARETSLVLSKLLLDLYQHHRISRTRIAEELHLSPGELDGLLFGLVISGLPGGRTGSPSAKSADLARVK